MSAARSSTPPRPSFGRYWERWLARRRPYLEQGTWADYEVHGRKRLLPAFADKRLGALSFDDIRAFVADQAEAVEAGERAAKTVNNALVTIVFTRVIDAHPGRLVSGRSAS